MADLFAMLSDPTRVRLLTYLEEHDEACVTEPATCLDLGLTRFAGQVGYAA
jgi:DNA-binding transcriptional ArsR family regulator